MTLRAYDPVTEVPANTEVVVEVDDGDHLHMKQTPLLRLIHSHGNQRFFSYTLLHFLFAIANESRLRHYRNFACGKAHRVNSCSRIIYEPADLHLRMEEDIEAALFRRYFFQWLRFKVRTLFEN